MQDPHLDFFTQPGYRIPDPGVKKAPDPGSRIRNTALRIQTANIF